MKIKVLFLINSLHRGGAERNFLNQANGLDKNRFEVYFVTILSEKKQDSFQPELKIEPEKKICFGFNNLFDLKAWFGFLRFLARQKFDIIYSTLFFANFLNRMGRLLTFFNKTKSIIREANVADIKPKKEILADWILSSATSKIVAVSQKVAESIVAREKISEEKIIVIHNGVRAPRQFFDREVSRAKFNLGFFDFVFLNVGMFKTEQKGQKYLIEAFDLLKKDKPQRNIKLLFVGEGRMRKECEDLARLRGLAKDVIFAGLQKDMDDIYQAADVFVLSSLWEGCPNVLLEAMINKLPVIASEVGGVGEIVLHSETGCLIKPRNIAELKQAMAFMLENPQKRAEFGEKGFERVARDFSLQKNIKKLEFLFNEVISARGGSAFGGKTN